MFITDQIGDACISLKNEQNEPVLPVPSMKLKKKKKFTQLTVTLTPPPGDILRLTDVMTRWERFRSQIYNDSLMRCLDA